MAEVLAAFEETWALTGNTLTKQQQAAQRADQARLRPYEAAPRLVVPRPSTCPCSGQARLADDAPCRDFACGAGKRPRRASARLARVAPALSRRLR